ncbi:MAG: adenylate/guanylate cyclase domain-containing protein [Desulfobacteraceae bacterium]
MKTNIPDILNYEEKIFKTRRVLQKAVRFSLDLMKARQTGLLYGTDTTKKMFLPPEKWDRGVIHKFDRRGIKGLLSKFFGRLILTFSEFSHVKLYKIDESGERVDNDGIIAYVLKNFTDYYKKGIRILIINNIEENTEDKGEFSFFSKLPVLSFNGRRFEHLKGLKVNRAIVRKFNAKNFIIAYVPDYGVLAVNTADPELLRTDTKGFVHETELKKRLNFLMRAIEMTSIAYLGVARGQRAVQLIWRKERYLRKTAAQLEEQKLYLKAVGGIEERQLKMKPFFTDQGVYAFVDMVGSARIRQLYSPEDYFFITNVYRQIVSNIAALYLCRVGNFIGDALFFQNVSVFDPEKLDYVPDLKERTMLMILVLVTMFRELDQLVKGMHPIDIDARVSRLLKKWHQKIFFRSGIESGPATIGPVGNKQRMIITAIGEAVDNASRLEATGVANGIHMSKNIMEILQKAEISKETKVLYGILTQKNSCLCKMFEKECISLNKNGHISFFDFYKSGFAACGDMIRIKRNVRYKEFSCDRTYLLQWDRKRKPQQRVCFGI